MTRGRRFGFRRSVCGRDASHKSCAGGRGVARFLWLAGGRRGVRAGILRLGPRLLRPARLSAGGARGARLLARCRLVRRDGRTSWPARFSPPICRRFTAASAFRPVTRLGGGRTIGRRVRLGHRGRAMATFRRCGRERRRLGRDERRCGQCRRLAVVRRARGPRRLARLTTARASPDLIFSPLWVAAILRSWGFRWPPRSSAWPRCSSRGSSRPGISRGRRRTWDLAPDGDAPGALGGLGHIAAREAADRRGALARHRIHHARSRCSADPVRADRPDHASLFAAGTRARPAMGRHRDGYRHRRRDARPHAGRLADAGRC